MDEATKDQILETTCAKIAHDVWAHWIKYQFSQCEDIATETTKTIEKGSLIIPADKVERWKRQMETGFEDLPANEQASDIEIARQFFTDLVSQGD